MLVYTLSIYKTFFCLYSKSSSHCGTSNLAGSQNLTNWLMFRIDLEVEGIVILAYRSAYVFLLASTRFFATKKTHHCGNPGITLFTWNDGASTLPSSTYSLCPMKAIKTATVAGYPTSDTFSVDTAMFPTCVFRYRNCSFKRIENVRTNCLCPPPSILQLLAFTKDESSGLRSSKM